MLFGPKMSWENLITFCQQRPSRYTVSILSMQGHPGRQACRPPTERMRPVPIEAKGGRAFLLDRLHHLADTREPAPPWRGPRPLARALGRAEHVGTGGRPPRGGLGGQSARAKVITIPDSVVRQVSTSTIEVLLIVKR